MANEHSRVASDADWDPAPPTMPQRSRFLHLPPIGVGTPMVESLRSYGTRLAAAHAVSRTTLFRRGVYTFFDPGPHGGYVEGKRYGKMQSKLLGGCEVAARWVAAFQVLTGRCDLHYLTLLPWNDTLEHGSPTRDTAWCAACYDEMAKAGGGHL